MEFRNANLDDISKLAALRVKMLNEEMSCYNKVVTSLSKVI